MIGPDGYPRRSSLIQSFDYRAVRHPESEADKRDENDHEHNSEPELRTLWHHLGLVLIGAHGFSL